VNRWNSAEPNVTPMIDVLLVLLITFMVLSAQMHHTMDAQLPSPAPCDFCPGLPAIVLEVLPGPRYRIDQAPVKNGEGELLSRLTAIYHDRPEKLIYVAGSPGVPYGDVVGAMDIAKSAGVRIIGVMPKAR
jgi:biopolymer transport protein ExbD